MFAVSPVCSGKRVFFYHSHGFLGSWAWLPTTLELTLSFQPRKQCGSSFWPSRIETSAFQTLSPNFGLRGLTEIDWTACTWAKAALKTESSFFCYKGRKMTCSSYGSGAESWEKCNITDSSFQLCQFSVANNGHPYIGVNPLLWYGPRFQRDCLCFLRHLSKIRLLSFFSWSE